MIAKPPRVDVIYNPHEKVVVFTEAERQLARDLAVIRQAPKELPGSTAVDHRVNKHLSNEDTHEIGLLGELAVARLMGLEVDKKGYIGNDGGQDFEIDGVTIDVKTLRGFLYFKYRSSLKADIALLVIYEPGKLDSVRVQGFIGREEFWAAKLFPQDFGYGVTNCIQPADLHRLAMLRGHCAMLAGARLQKRDKMMAGSNGLATAKG